MKAFMRHLAKESPQMRRIQERAAGKSADK